MTDRRAKRSYERAKRAYVAGRLDEAASLATAHVATFDASQPSGHEVAALMYELLARVQLDQGQAQMHLESLLNAERAVLDRGDCDPDVLGRVQHQVATALLDLQGMSEMSREYFRRVKATLANSLQYAELRDTAAEMLVESEPTDWKKQAQTLSDELVTTRVELHALRAHRWSRRQKAQEQGLLWRVISLEKRLALLYIGHGSDDEVEDGFGTCAAVAMTVYQDDPDEFFALMDNVGFALDRDLDLSYFLDDVAAAGLKIAARSGADEHRAAAHYLAAATAVMAGKDTEALPHALTAVTLSERSAAASPSIVYRAASRASLDQRRHLALVLCAKSERWPGVAELIERGRLQALPRADAETLAALTDRLEAEQSTDVLASLRGSDVQLNPIQGVHAEGSDLSDHDSNAPPVGGALSLDRAREAVGGPGSWWWGLWVGLGEVICVARSPSGAWSGGRTVLEPAAHDAATTLDRLYHLGHPTADEVGDSPIFDPDAERALMGAIAAPLFPPALAGALRDAVEPLDVVAAGNFLGYLPLAALVIPGSDRRLVEAAVVRVQPPAVITHVVDQRPVPSGDECPFQIAVVDPTGDLPYSRHLESGASATLTHPTNIDGSRGNTRPATFVEVDQALTNCPGGNGLLLYSGHVDEISGTGVLALSLTDGLLPSLAMFGRPWRMPSKVILSGCGSAGSAGAGSGEWVGLAAAFLAAGARQVIATAWPIPDEPFTADFEIRLARLLHHGIDPAVALRELQLDSLIQWQHERTPDARPLVWAAYQFMGVAL